jgi:hypothetical protein
MLRTFVLYVRFYYKWYGATHLKTLAISFFKKCA